MRPVQIPGMATGWRVTACECDGTRWYVEIRKPHARYEVVGNGVSIPAAVESALSFTKARRYPSAEHLEKLAVDILATQHTEGEGGGDE